MAVGNKTGTPWRVFDDVGPLAKAVRRPSYSLDLSLADDFASDGVIYLPGCFKQWVEPLRDGLQRNLDSPDSYAFGCESTTTAEAGRFFDAYCNWQAIPEYLSFVLSSHAASLAAATMGSQTAQFFHEHAFSKDASTQKATPWHQDLPYYCVEGTQTVSIYVSLDSISADTAVRFLPGSHRSGELFRPRSFRDGVEYDNSDSAMVSAIDRDIASNPEVICRALEPGDAVLFDFRTLHGSGDAPISGRRRAFSTRWLGDDVRYYNRPGETSPPLADLGLKDGERMRADWFPVMWPN